MLDAESAKDDNDYSGQMEKLDEINSIETDSGVVKDKANEYKSKAEEFTIDEAIEIAETEAGIDKNDKSENHPYVIVAKEPFYNNGKKLIQLLTLNMIVTTGFTKVFMYMLMM